VLISISCLKMSCDICLVELSSCAAAIGASTNADRPKIKRFNVPPGCTSKTAHAATLKTSIVNAIANRCFDHIQEILYSELLAFWCMLAIALDAGLSLVCKQAGDPLKITSHLVSGPHHPGRFLGIEGSL
jgi:hypothetical protein